MDLTSLEMKQTNFRENMTIGLINVERSVERDDRLNGVDGWLDNDIPFAFRKRPNLSLDSYKGKVITIRIGKESSGGYFKFEYDKLLNGQFKAVVYFFKLKESLLVCPTTSLIDYLKVTPRNDLDISPNKYGESDLVAIHPNALKDTFITPLSLPMRLGAAK